VGVAFRAVQTTEATDDGNGRLPPGVVRRIAPGGGRIRPPWAGLPEDADAAPRLYILEGCTNLIEQLKNAPVKKEGRSEDLYEIVDPDWESRHGHAHAAARYGAMSRPRPSGPEPEAIPEDPRARLLYEVEKRRDSETYYADRYVWP
jgi:hypothetical protein